MSNTRLLFLAGGVLASLLIGGGVAGADDRAQREPAMSTQASSFELFGRKICVADARRPECDVRLDRNKLLTPLVLQTSKARHWKVRGVTFCDKQDTTGAKCDIVWAPPVPAMAWRDYPEVRVADDLAARGR